MEKLAITLRTYTNDGWYGKRYRYYYLGPDGNGFKNKTEANKFKSKLKKYVKEHIKFRTNCEIDGDCEVNILENFITYKYMGAGPSYSCTNVEVKSL